MSDSPTGPQPEHLPYAPYVQLVKMLVPSAGTVSLYGPGEDLRWCSDGYERPDLHQLVDRVRREPGRSARLHGTIEVTPAGLTAYLTELEDEHGRHLGTLVVELTAPPERAGMAASLLRPVVECLQSRLAAEHPPAARAGPDVDALAGMLDDEDDAVQRLLAGCVDAMSADIAALVVPEAHVETLATSPGLERDAAARVVEATRERVTAALESADQAFAVNKCGDDAPGAGYKVLAGPIRDPHERIKGYLALYRTARSADFDGRDTPVIEYLSRKVSMLLNREHDALTGLLTREAFERHAEGAIASASQAALLYVDVDHLHQVNEALGFECGDRVLAFVAGRIGRVLGRADLGARIGGDRFALLIPDAGPEEGRARADQLQALLAESDYVHDDQAIPVTATIGVAAAAAPAVRHLVAAAELASKRAKQRGPGRVATSQRLETARPAVERALFAYRRFEDALADNALALEAQPIFGLAIEPGRPIGFEMLVRMRSPRGEWLSAHRFLSAAEHCGLLPAIDRWVVATTLEQLKTLRAMLPELPLGVSVNVSSQSLESGGYARYALELLSHAGLPARLLGFEVREADAWSRIAAADRFMHKLGAAGARIGLDNFGSGAGSIAQLRALPIGHVKLNGALLRRSLDDRESAGLVEGLTRAAHGLGLTTVAEQVETEALAAMLEALHVDYAQGFYFGHPAPLEDWLGRIGAEGGAEAEAAAGR